MALTPGAKIFLGAAAAVGVGALLMRRTASTEHRAPASTTRYDINRFDEARTSKGTTMTPEWSKGSAYADAGAFSTSSGSGSSGTTSQRMTSPPPFPHDPDADSSTGMWSRNQNDKNQRSSGSSMNSSPPQRGSSSSRGFESAIKAAERSSNALVGTTEDSSTMPSSSASRSSSMTPSSGARPAPGYTRDSMQATGRDMANIASAHGRAAIDDVRQAGWEVTDSMNGRGSTATVRSVPDPRTYGSQVRTHTEPLPSAAQSPHEASSLVERVKGAAEVVSAHARAAVDDIKHVGHEVKDTLVRATEQLPLLPERDQHSNAETTRGYSSSGSSSNGASGTAHWERSIMAPGAASGVTTYDRYRSSEVSSSMTPANASGKSEGEQGLIRAQQMSQITSDSLSATRMPASASAPSSSDAGGVRHRDVVREHAKGAAADAQQTAADIGTVSRAHMNAASRDVSGVVEEVQDALTAPVLKGSATVRSTPDPIRDPQAASRDQKYRVATRNAANPAAQRAPSIVDRLGEAVDVVGAHARGAVEDTQQAGREVSETVSRHRDAAYDDVAHARKEVDDVAQGKPKNSVEVHNPVPFQAGSSMSKVPPRA